MDTLEQWNMSLVAVKLLSASLNPHLKRSLPDDVDNHRLLSIASSLRKAQYHPVLG